MNNLSNINRLQKIFSKFSVSIENKLDPVNTFDLHLNHYGRNSSISLYKWHKYSWHLTVILEMPKTIRLKPDDPTRLASIPKTRTLNNHAMFQNF